MPGQRHNEAKSRNSLNAGSESLLGRSLATLAVLGVMFSCAFGVTETVSPMENASAENIASNEIALLEKNSSKPYTNNKTEQNKVNKQEEDSSTHSKKESESADLPQEEPAEDRLAENGPLAEIAETQQTQEQDSNQIEYVDQSSGKTSWPSEHQNNASENISSESTSQPTPALEPELVSELVPEPEPEPAPVEVNISVSVSVSSDAVGNPVSGTTTVSLPQGATAYDALMASGFAVDAKNTAYGLYVAGIGGLVEKQHGGASGWLYAVNGTTPGQSAATYVLNGGDAVSWFYTT